jgi:hypothetical protein
MPRAKTRVIPSTLADANAQKAGNSTLFPQFQFNVHKKHSFIHTTRKRDIKQLTFYFLLKFIS